MKLYHFINKFIKGGNSKHVFLMIFIFSFILRLTFMNDGLFHHDSVQLARATEETVKELNLVPSVNGRYGLVLINALFFSVPHFLFNIDSAEFTVTFVTILLSSLAFGVIYLFVRELTNNDFIAITSSIMISVSPIFLSITTYAKSHGPALVFIMLSGYSLLRALKSGSNFLWFLFSLNFAYALFIRLDSLFYFIPFGILYLFQKRSAYGSNEKFKRFNLKKLIILAIPFFLLFLLSLEYKEIFHITESDKIPFNDTSLLLSLFKVSSLSLIHSITIPALIFTLLSIVYLLYKKKIHTIIFLLLWFLAIFLPLSLTTVTSPRLFSGSVVPIIIMCGFGLNEIYKKYKKTAILIFILLSATMIVSIYPVVNFRHHYSGPKEYALFLKENTEENAVIISNDNSVFINYYSNRTTISYPRHGSKKQVSQAVLNIHQLLDKNISVYVSDWVLLVDKYSPKLTLESNFNIIPIGAVTTEQYRHAELQLQKINISVYEISKKEGMTADNIVTYYSIPK